METKSEHKEAIENPYKIKLNTLVAENRSFFITGLIVFIFIIYIFLLQIGDQIVAQIQNTYSSFISYQKEKMSSTPQTNLSDRLTNKSINYISPVISPHVDKLETNGQISAISSGQVTYTKNKYIVQRGDSLASIAQKVYGDREAWVRIAKANKLESPDSIEIGMELVIPR